jgi:hypothetical protein
VVSSITQQSASVTVPFTSSATDVGTFTGRTIEMVGGSKTYTQPYGTITKFTFGGFEYTFSVDALSADTSYTYQAILSIGSSTYRTQNITVRTIPHTVTFQPGTATQIMATSATVNIPFTTTAQSAATFTGYKIQVGTTSGIYTRDITTGGTLSLGSLTMPITGLTRLTQYFYRAQMTIGSSTYTSPQYSLTSTDYSFVVNGTSAIGANYSEFSVTYTTDVPNPSPTLQLTSVPTTTSVTWKSTTPTNTPNTYTSVYWIYPLTPNTAYTYSVQLTSGTYTRVYGGTFTTLASLFNPVIVVTSTTATITLNYISKSLMAGDNAATAAVLKLRPIASNDQYIMIDASVRTSTGTTIPTNSGLTIYLNGLTANTAYVCSPRVQVLNRNNLFDINNDYRTYTFTTNINDFTANPPRTFTYT